MTYTDEQHWINAVCFHHPNVVITKQKLSRRRRNQHDDDGGSVPSLRGCVSGAGRERGVRRHPQELH
ncbi:hypothetical protein E2C01_062913 [Portunus trituberculatus]|uniref:Uncharacterized protein n=1 Tax=Portunus trituberculatus TaxID=210409 RepID=A0A5B7HG64_PORTR|nr:hypothetical protein [Portunus trituberculatus]